MPFHCLLLVSGILIVIVAVFRANHPTIVYNLMLRPTINCREKCKVAHIKHHKVSCVFPEESAALIAAEYLNSPEYRDADADEEKVVEAVEKAIELCHNNRSKTLTLVRVLNNWPLLNNEGHIGTAEIMRMFGLHTSLVDKAMKIVTLLRGANVVHRVNARASCRVAALRALRDSECAPLRQALLASGALQRNPETVELEQAIWDVAMCVGDDTCKLALTQWLEFATACSCCKSSALSEFFSGSMDSHVHVHVPNPVALWPQSLTWAEYVDFLWWQLAWIMEYSPEAEGCVAPPDTRPARLVEDFRQGEEEEARCAPGYEPEPLPPLEELRDNFLEFYKHEFQSFRRYCVANECWEGPFIWMPASMIECESEFESESAVGGELLAGIRYRRKGTVAVFEKLNLKLLYIP